MRNIKSHARPFACAGVTDDVQPWHPVSWYLAAMKLLVWYLSGLDVRWVTPERMPFLAEACATHAKATVTNLPSNELLPTMLTGCYPGTHGVWGVRLDPSADPRQTTWVDRLPDVVTTSAQCIAHGITRKWDLPGIPPRRRRSFDITRTKYLRRNWPEKTLPVIGGVPSLLGVLGPERSRYVFNTTTNPRKALLAELAGGRYDLEFVELYSLDRMQQWHGPDHPKTAAYYRYIDDLTRDINDKCRANGVTLVVVSDHGHEPVTHTIDIPATLRATGVPDDEYNYFLELTILRLWFFTDRAREAIAAALREIDGVDVLTHSDLKPLHLDLDERYGELFALNRPGTIFFPHDFYQPLANAWLGLTDRKQWPRLWNPAQRHNHGYRVGHLCEQGLLLALDDSLRAKREKIELIDIAPTVLELIDEPLPDHMRGTTAFTRSSA